MTSRTQQQRAEVTNTPPQAGSLKPGQLYVELADPMRLWAGVPTGLNANRQKLLYDAAIGGQALNKTGDTATGLINFSAGINVSAAPCTVPTAAQDTNSNAAANTAFVLNQAATTAPVMDGTAAVGTSLRYARQDHVHPHDTTNPVPVTDTPPASPTPGTFWFDSAGLQLYLRYNDGTSTQWVPTSNQTGLPEAPSDGTIYGRQNALWARATPEAPSDGNLYARRNAAWAQAAPAGAINSVGRNLIHNPLFNVAQRGAGPFTGGNNYTLDRWTQFFSGSGASLSTSPFAATDAHRAQIGDEACKQIVWCNFTGTAGASDATIFTQQIEDVQRLSGKTVTVSFWAAASAGQRVGVSFDQNFGSGGSPSSPVLLAGQATAALTAAFVRYSLTFSLPSMAGKTLGTNPDNVTSLHFWLSAGSSNATRAGSIGVQSGSIYLWGIQLEIGTQATPLEKPDPRYDLANCQRFYQVGDFTNNGGLPAAGYVVQTSIPLPVRMRATPTAIAGTPTNNVNLTGPAITALSAATLYFSASQTAGGSGYSYTNTWSASADL